jgi:hypothetical protein
MPLVACWRYEPREHLRLLALARPLVPPSPLRDGVGYSDHDRFRGYFPVHFIPAYNLPVYASQRPLPDATQDSVRGCSLGFAAAVIADGRLQRACKAQPAQIRTSPIRAYGLYGAFIVKGASRHFGRPLHSILLFDPRREHSSVPTAYFHRRRAQRQSRTALLQRRRRLVLDGREHGGRLPAIGWLAAR